MTTPAATQTQRSKGHRPSGSSRSRRCRRNSVAAHAMSVAGYASALHRIATAPRCIAIGSTAIDTAIGYVRPLDFIDAAAPSLTRCSKFDCSQNTMRMHRLHPEEAFPQCPGVEAQVSSTIEQSPAARPQKSSNTSVNATGLSRFFRVPRSFLVALLIAPAGGQSLRRAVRPVVFRHRAAGDFLRHPGR